MNRNFLLALLWSFVLLIDIISCIGGNEPSWILVFCPLVILVLQRWEDYFYDKHDSSN